MTVRVYCLDKPNEPDLFTKEQLASLPAPPPTTDKQHRAKVQDSLMPSEKMDSWHIRSRNEPPSWTVTAG